MLGRLQSEVVPDLIDCVGDASNLRLALRLALETFDVRRRFGAIRTRLVAVDGRLRASADRRVHAADARFRATAARLDSLSPLAVLGRGYAVCWNADRTAIVRDAATVQPGDQVHVKLERGELDCAVTSHGDTQARHEPQRSANSNTSIRARLPDCWAAICRSDYC